MDSLLTAHSGLWDNTRAVKTPTITRLAKMGAPVSRPSIKRACHVDHGKVVPTHGMDSSSRCEAGGFSCPQAFCACVRSLEWRGRPTPFRASEKAQAKPLDSLREMCDTSSYRRKSRQTCEKRALLELSALVRDCVVGRDKCSARNAKNSWPNRLTIAHEMCDTTAVNGT